MAHALVVEVRSGSTVTGTLTPVQFTAWAKANLGIGSRESLAAYVAAFNASKTKRGEPERVRLIGDTPATVRVARNPTAPLPKTATDARGVRWTVKKDREWNEWQVVAYVGGKRDEDKTYHANGGDAASRQDAIDTFHQIMRSSAAPSVNPAWRWVIFRSNPNVAKHEVATAATLPAIRKQMVAMFKHLRASYPKYNLKMDTKASDIVNDTYVRVMIGGTSHHHQLFDSFHIAQTSKPVET